MNLETYLELSEFTVARIKGYIEIHDAKGFTGYRIATAGGVFMPEFVGKKGVITLQHGDNMNSELIGWFCVSRELTTRKRRKA